jgi:hypothetical protein
VPYVPNLYPWPTYRGNPHRTGEYAFDVPTPVAVSDVQATYAERLGVQLSWRADPSEAGTELLWRLRRIGPFDDDPLADPYFPHYTEAPLGEIRGSGRLVFVDADIARGSWYAYRIELQETGTSGGTETTQVAVLSVQAGVPPAALRLLANVPNPFNPGTQIEFEVPKVHGAAAPIVRLHIFDVQGRLVRSLVQEPLAAGFGTTTQDYADDSRYDYRIVITQDNTVISGMSYLDMIDDYEIYAEERIEGYVQGATIVYSEVETLVLDNATRDQWCLTQTTLTYQNINGQETLIGDWEYTLGEDPDCEGISGRVILTRQPE